MHSNQSAGGGNDDSSSDVVMVFNAENNQNRWKRSFGFEAVPDGKKLIRMGFGGNFEEIAGPSMIFSFWNRVYLLDLVTAGPKEYIEISFLSGEKQVSLDIIICAVIRCLFFLVHARAMPDFY